MIVSGGVAWIREPSRPAGTTSTPRASASSASPSRARSSPRPCQPACSKRSPASRTRPSSFGTSSSTTRRGGARERVPDVRVRVDVLRPELPGLLEPVAVEERRRERQAAAERLADAEHVRDLLARPHLADAAEPRIDRVDDEQRSRLVAAAAKQLEEAVRRNARPGSSLNRLDDHAAGVLGQRPGILAVRAPVHRPGQPGRERLAELLEAGRREREETGPVIRPLERDDARPAGGEQRRPQRDLDRVLAGHAELRRPRQRLAQPHGHLGVGQVAERVHDLLLPPGLEDPRIAVPERRDPEAAGQVEQLAPVGERDAAALGSRPDHFAPSRRTRPAVAFAIVPAIAGFSCSRRSE